MLFNLHGSGWILECYITCQSHLSSAVCHRGKKKTPCNSYLTSRVFCWHLEQSNLSWNMTGKCTEHDYKLDFHWMKNQKNNLYQRLCSLSSYKIIAMDSLLMQPEIVSHGTWLILVLGRKCFQNCSLPAGKSKQIWATQNVSIIIIKIDLF